MGTRGSTGHPLGAGGQQGHAGTGSALGRSWASKRRHQPDKGLWAPGRLSPRPVESWPRAGPHRVHSPGQGGPWQALVSRPLPLQLRPPICGTGELQRRMRVTLPTPQVTEQEDHGDQWLQPPSCRTSAGGKAHRCSEGLAESRLGPPRSFPPTRQGRAPVAGGPNWGEGPRDPQDPGAGLTLTAVVAPAQAAGPRLDGRPQAGVAGDVTGAAPLLGA